ncbi:MAG: T9SS type A sorting domain-containing protein, partial [Flavobacteriales bacterium]|nr:T9SS type A sorting domain-containing protein [Flavobacteriales bacterium]
YMSTFKYNDNNISVQNEYHSWDPIANEWVLHSRTTSTYIDPKPIVEVEEKSASWNLFPNPSDGDVFIELEEPRNADARVVVMNKLGQPVFADIISARQTELVLDLELLPNGNYIVRVDDGTDVSSKQVVIQQ